MDLPDAAYAIGEDTWRPRSGWPLILRDRADNAALTAARVALREHKFPDKSCPSLSSPKEESCRERRESGK